MKNYFYMFVLLLPSLSQAFTVNLDCDNCDGSKINIPLGASNAPSIYMLYIMSVMILLMLIMLLIKCYVRKKKEANDIWLIKVFSFLFLIPACLAVFQKCKNDSVLEHFAKSEFKNYEQQYVIKNGIYFNKNDEKFTNKLTYDGIYLRDVFAKKTIIKNNNLFYEIKWNEDLKRNEISLLKSK